MKVECAESLKAKEIESEGLYAGVENQTIKNIHGCPLRAFNLRFKLVQSNGKRAFQIGVASKDFNPSYCTIEVPEERVFRDIIPGSVNGKQFDTEIAALAYRKGPVTRLISKYVKKQLQTVQVGVDVPESLVGGGTP